MYSSLNLGGLVYSSHNLGGLVYGSVTFGKSDLDKVNNDKRVGSGIITVTIITVCTSVQRKCWQCKPTN